MQPMNDSVAWIEQLLIDVPELREPYELHRKDYKDLLPHVFMADIVCFVLQELENPDRQAALIRLLGRLDEGLRLGSEEVVNVIAVSFAENLMGETTRLRKLWPLMGATLRKEVEKFCGGQIGDA